MMIPATRTSPLLIACILCVLNGCSTRPQAPATTPAAQVDRARLAYAQGRFEDAAVDFERAAHSLDGQDPLAQADILLDLGSARTMIGHHDAAADALIVSYVLARDAGDKTRQARALNALGVVYTFNPAAGQSPTTRPATHPVTTQTSHCDPGKPDARAVLQCALELARETGDTRQQAAVLNNLGNLDTKTGRFDQAQTHYADAARAARGADPLLESQSLLNAALAALGALEGETDPARQPPHRQRVQDFNDKGATLAHSLPDSHDKAFLLTTAGDTSQRLAELDPDRAQSHQAAARAHYERAIRSAQSIGDQRSLSFATGQLAATHLRPPAGSQPDLAAAEQLTRRAILAAQRARSPDSLYRWQWQNARLLKARWERDHSQDALEQCIAFYDAAVQTVGLIRNDISLGRGNQRKRLSFREALGSLYFEYADVLLRRVDTLQGDKAIPDARRDQLVNALYDQARDTVEMLKTVELENYFKDECVHLLKSKQKKLEQVEDPRTAVVYLIPLPDRTEILVSFPGGRFVRRTSNIAEPKLREDALAFRHGLTNLLERTYSAPGRRLFTALISPIRQDLEDRNIDTLVFVPDGVLRTIPMAALRDPADDTFLIQHFAVAITPGLTLMEPTPLQRSRVEVLAAGLAVSKSVGDKNFAALSNVPDELASLKSRYQSTVLLNKDFTRENLRESLKGREFSAVHVASHAVFEREASESYLVTFDDTPMTLNDIERLIRPFQLRQKPVELLTLSACQTAAGDERAALGLAGIAVKAGARSSLASLWCVNDRATSVLMEDFYEALSAEATSQGKALSKAKALQAAQLKMIHERGYRHPCFWAPFQLIGNWL